MSDPVLSRRRPGDLRLPAFPLPGGGSVRPSTMTDPAPDYGVTIDYVVDTDDLVFALGIFVGVEFPGEAAGFLADPAATLAAQVDGVAPAPPGLPGPLRSVPGLPGYRIDERVEDRIECTLERCHGFRRNADPAAICGQAVTGAAPEDRRKPVGAVARSRPDVAALKAALVSAAVLAAAPAGAWEMGAFDNGSWFEAHVVSPDRTVHLHCGGTSPTGLPLPQSDEPMLTDPYTLRLRLSHPGLGRPAGFSGGARADLMVVSGAAGYGLPRADWDLLNDDAWIQPLGLGDPLIAALRGTAAIAVDADGTRHQVIDGAGLGNALDRAMAFCDARWAATGQPLPASAAATVSAVRTRGLGVAPTAAPSGQQPAPSRAPGQPPRDPSDLSALDPEGTRLLGAANAHVLRGCGRAPSRLDPGYAEAADIDGDGRTDILLAWDSIDCGGAQPRPFCGASQCLVEVFLTRLPGAPQGLYASGVRIAATTDGRSVVEAIGRLATCSDADDPARCAFYWGWTGTAFGRLGGR